MIVEGNVELAETLRSRNRVALFVARLLWDAVLVLVCVAIIAVIVVGVLEGAELGA